MIHDAPGLVPTNVFSLVTTWNDFILPLTWRRLTHGLVAGAVKGRRQVGHT